MERRMQSLDEFINETRELDFITEVEDIDFLDVRKSMQQNLDKTKVGQKTESTEMFDVYLRKDVKNGDIYTLVEKNPNERRPLVYVYSLSKGNLTRGSGDKWARQEICSTSAAFHKGKETKMAIPNNLEKAIEIATTNAKNYKAKD
jgi:hypothetical protein